MNSCRAQVLDNRLERSKKGFFQEGLYSFPNERFHDAFTVFTTQVVSPPLQLSFTGKQKGQGGKCHLLSILSISSDCMNWKVSRTSLHKVSSCGVQAGIDASNLISNLLTAGCWVLHSFPWTSQNAVGLNHSQLLFLCQCSGECFWCMLAWMYGAISQWKKLSNWGAE